MLKKIRVIAIIVFLLSSTGFAKPETGQAWIASYLRSQPEKSTPVKKNVVCTIKKDSKLTIKDFHKGWYFVETTSGEKGWIYRKLIKIYDKDGQLMENYNPYKDKFWKKTDPEKNQPSFPKKKPIAIKNKSEKKLEEINKESSPQKTPPKTTTNKKVDKNQLALADTIINIGKRIDSLEERISVLESKNVSSAQINQINTSITSLQKKQNDLIKEYENIEPSTGDDSIMLWFLIICIVIGIVFIARITARNRKMLEEQNTNLKSSIQNILKIINTNFNKVEIINRDDYVNILNTLQFLNLIDNNTIKKIFESLDKNSNDFSKIPDSIWARINSSEFSELIEKIIQSYAEFETSSVKKGKARSLLKDKVVQLKDFKNSNKPDFKLNKKNIAWLKDLKSVSKNIEDTKKELISNMSSNEYKNFFLYLKKRFPADTSNIKINMEHKNWKKALELLKKLKIENLELK